MGGSDSNRDTNKTKCMSEKKGLYVERVEHSYGTGFEGRLEESIPFVVVTSYSFLQLLFHHPLLFFRTRIRIDHLTIFGNYESLVNEDFFGRLLDFLAEKDEVFFFFRAKNKRWILDLESEYEGKVLDDLEAFFDEWS